MWLPSPGVRILLSLSLLPIAFSAVPMFESVSVTDSSFVIRLINGEDVSHIDMAVHIFDIDRLEEFRKTELKSSDRDELFSFDALRPSTWFAFQIHYRVILVNASNHHIDLVNKQDLVVHTKGENSALASGTVEDVVAYVEETFITTADLYVSVRSVFTDYSKVMTMVVAELRCPGKGVVKPIAQKINHHARFHFKITALGDDVILENCESVCIFPYLRVAIRNSTSQTFRGREWCGNIQRVVELGADHGTNSTPSSCRNCLFALFLCYFITQLWK